TPEQVDNLLRHRLLRKPGGFEGVVVIPEVLDVEDPSFANRVDDRALQVHLAAKARAMEDHPHDHSITGVDEVADRFKASASQVSRSRSNWRMTASRPRMAPARANLRGSAR